MQYSFDIESVVKLPPKNVFYLRVIYEGESVNRWQMQVKQL
jgi:hypothetical protein